MKRRSRFAGGIVLALALFMVLPLGAFAQEKVTLRFFHKWPEEPYNTYFNDMVAKYEELNPHIDIVVNSAADQPYKTQIRVVMSSSTPPDIYFAWPGDYTANFVRAGRALDLTDYFYGTEWEELFPESIVSSYKVDGRLYAIPIRLSAKFMLYNKEMFDKYGLSVPETWDEFLEVCEVLKSNGITPIAFGNRFPWAAIHYLTTFNQKLVDPETLAADYLLSGGYFEHPGYLEALKMFTLLNEKGYFNAFPNAYLHADARSMWWEEQAAMFYAEIIEFTHLSPVGEAPDAFKDKWGFFPFPAIEHGEGNQRFITGAPDGFLINADTKYPEECVDFLRFLTSVENAQEWVRRIQVVSPVIGSVTEETAFKGLVEAMEVIGELEGMNNWLDTELHADIARVYLDGSQALLEGTKTPEQVLKEVQEAGRIVRETLGSN